MKADPAQPESTPRPKAAIYDEDPRHLWNRLYTSLYVRTGLDGKEYGQDQIDPLLWPSSRHLLIQPGHGQALVLLDEFLANHGEKLVRDPLKRALFQHDLWGIFNWLAEPYPEHRRETSELISERRELRNRLARIIAQLALTAKQIQALPDNYVAAVASKVFPPQHDSSRANKAFLPPDLWDPMGPWVILGARAFLPSAAQHLDFAQGRSAFFVLMKHPRGRQAALDYLEKLRSFPNPLEQVPLDGSGRLHPKSGSFLNPDLPQFPPGSMFALVREVMLVDAEGKLSPTRLIESVQLRVFLEVPKKNDLPPEKQEDYVRHCRNAKQDFYEFQFRRKDLFSDKAGGLHPLHPGEPVFSLFSVMDEDLLAGRSQDLGGEAATENLQTGFSCAACHGQGPGIHSVLSFRRNPPPDLMDSNRFDQEQVAIRMAKRGYAWGLLQGLLEK